MGKNQSKLSQQEVADLEKNTYCEWRSSPLMTWCWFAVSDFPD
jgi:hypothetical protein